MAFVRSLLANRHLALLILTAALAIRVLVPGGYMLAAERGTITVMVCSGVAGQTMTMAMPGMPGMPEHGQKDGHAGVEQPCAFAGLSHQALGAADAVLVLAAVAFIMALGIAPAPRPSPQRVAHLRPPLRGPPSTC